MCFDRDIGRANETEIEIGSSHPKHHPTIIVKDRKPFYNKIGQILSNYVQFQDGNEEEGERRGSGS